MPYIAFLEYGGWIFSLSKVRHRTRLTTRRSAREVSKHGTNRDAGQGSTASLNIQNYKRGGKARGIQKTILIRQKVELWEEYKIFFVFKPDEKHKDESDH